MTITIWIVKGLLAALFAFSGINKMLLPKAKLLNMGMKGLVNIGEKQIKGIGILESLGAIGLILPGLLNIYPVLSGFAALGLALTMIVAARIHHQLKLSVAANLVVFILCLIVAFCEFVGV